MRIALPVNLYLLLLYRSIQTAFGEPFHLHHRQRPVEIPHHQPIQFTGGFNAVHALPAEQREHFLNALGEYIERVMDQSSSAHQHSPVSIPEHHQLLRMAPKFDHSERAFLTAAVAPQLAVLRRKILIGNGQQSSKRKWKRLRYE